MTAKSFLLQSHSPAETRQLGIQLGMLLNAGDVICLSGDLGAGKTTFASGVGEGWGADQALTSPTFVLVRQYHHPFDKVLLYHLDAYRLEGAADSIELDDILDGGSAVLIEWAEHILADLPPDCLWISFAATANDETLREISLMSTGGRAERVLASFCQKVKCHAAGD